MNEVMKAKLDAVLYLEETLKAAHERRDKEFRELFPIGGPVSYVKHGRAVQTSTVERHGYDDDLFVTNPNTGRTIKISTYHILQARKAVEHD